VSPVLRRAYRHHNFVPLARPDLVIATRAAIRLHCLIRLHVPDFDAIRIVVDERVLSHAANGRCHGQIRTRVRVLPRLRVRCGPPRGPAPADGGATRRATPTRHRSTRISATTSLRSTPRPGSATGRTGTGSAAHRFVGTGGRPCSHDRPAVRSFAPSLPLLVLLRWATTDPVAVRDAPTAPGGEAPVRADRPADPQLVR
jgi:hypothetical protein